MSSADIDLTPLLKALEKITDYRVIAHAFDKSEGEFKRKQVPLKSKNEGDPKDIVLRRFIKDWILRHVEDVGVDVRFKDLPPRTSYYADDGTETLVIALLEVTWWPKRPMTEMEMMMAEQRRSKSWVGRK